jgi:hypothetical protein
MKWLTLFLLLMPSFAFAYVPGLDDDSPNISADLQEQLDLAITTYYQRPSPQKVAVVLDIMNDSPLLRKKTAWPATIGFLTVVFKDNKQHLFDWMALHDYNLYAEDVFVSALMHANLRETALVFAQAHHWKKSRLDQIRYSFDSVDLKHLTIKVPGHIDTLWGAFFASGDPVYVNEIINILFKKAAIDILVKQAAAQPPNAPPSEEAATLLENKKLAEKTLKAYAPLHKPVRDAVKARIASEKNEEIRSYLKHIILGAPEGTSGPE